MKVLILGASGSIGTQTIDVLKKHPSDFELVAFSVGTRTRNISSIIKRFPSVRFVYLIDDKKKREYQRRYPNIKFLSKEDGLESIITLSNPDLVVNALVGFVGFIPSVVTLKENRILALANKESLVVGGEIINNLLKEGHGKLVPIDSEHVALRKCLDVDSRNVKNLILTASGGSFKKLSREELKHVTVEDALKHPTWKMGNKITIDSASMMNKCFEVIEAHYLYNYPYEKIKILLHDESHIHSLVEYKDGTYRMDISKPDMRTCIEYALYLGNVSYKTYTTNSLAKLENRNYHLHEFSYERFPLVEHAKRVIKSKGTFGAALNAANEKAVYAFLAKRISFLQIDEVINYIMRTHKSIKNPSVEDIVRVNSEVSLKAEKYIESLKGENR